MCSRDHQIRRGLGLALFAAIFVFVAPAVHAAASGDSAKVTRLSVEVTRAEDVRAVKRLQISYAQYAQFGPWSQMTALFTDNAEAIYGGDDLKGRAAIGQYYLTKWGGGREGLPAGGLHTQFDDTPVVNLSADGKTAKGRWGELSMIGQHGGSASWAIGLMENNYVKEKGVWKISLIHYYPYIAGPYETGWKNVGPDLPVIPYHFTPAEAAMPAPAIPADLLLPAVEGSPTEALAVLQRRIAAMNDEDKVRNLQNAYGYYIDRKMWDDASDLFTTDGVLEEADVGIYSGAKSIRHGFDRHGPQGLKRGQLNEHPMFDMVVTVSPDGTQARTRGIEFSELGDFDTGTASLGLAVFENRFVKGTDGIWRIREMRIFPLAATDYYQGWAKSRLVTSPVTGEYAPDKATPFADTMTDGAIPVFFQSHPVTGKPVALPRGAKVTGLDALLPTIATPQRTTKTPKDMAAAIADAERRLSISTAYDAIDNITHAFGYYINDNKFDEEGALYAKDGWRGKQAVGFFVGPDHIAKGEFNWDNPLPKPRVQLSSRWMLQPVINVSDDGKTARERTRLHSFGMSPNQAGVLSGAMYPANAAKLEDGVWKFDVVSVEEPYWSSSSYADGWARYKAPPPPGPPAPGAPPPPARSMQPDVPRPQTMPIRFYGIDAHPNPADVILWPDIKPMWFNYKNPVSGRLPPLYCPDLKTCEKDLEAAKH